MIKMKNTLYLFIFLSLAISSCKTDTTTEVVLTSEEQELQTNPSKENAVKAINSLTDLISKSKDNKGEIKSLLSRGYSIAKEYKLTSKITAFLSPLVREYPDDPVQNNRLLELADYMLPMGKQHTAKIIYNSLAMKNFKNDKVINMDKSMKVESLDTFLKQLATSVFVNPDHHGLNRRASQHYVDACEAYVMANPKNKNAPDYLYKAAEIARSIKTYPKTLSLYDWVIDKYPSYEKVPTIYFLKGFILEDDLQNETAARNVYEEFLKKYPDNELAKDVQFLLDNLGKSNEEILQEIQTKK